MSEGSPQEIAYNLTSLVSHQRQTRIAVHGHVPSMVAAVHIAFIRIHYKALPERIARRLTEIEPKAIQSPTPKPEGDEFLAFCEKVASDKAFAQAIRAANIFRAKVDEIPLSLDGTLPGENTL